MGTGYATYYPGLGSNLYDMAVQSDGKIVATGVTRVNGNDDVLLVRFNVNGSLDQSFGAGGVVITGQSNSFDDAHGIVLQPDGKILLGGRVGNESAVFRYNTNGTLDTTFGGGDGIVSTDAAPYEDIGYDIALAPDGKIVTAGYAQTSNNDIEVIRYNANGTPDAGFGVGGTVRQPFGGGQAYGNGVLVEPGGSIVVVGSAGDNSAPNAQANGFAIARFSPSGTPVGGTVTQPESVGSDSAAAVIRQPDGKLIVVGYASDSLSNNFTQDFAIVRYNADLTVDTSFGGGDGIVRTNVDGSNRVSPATAVALQADGKIVVGGYITYDIGGAPSDFAVVRYNANGTLDTTFGGGDGIATQNFGFGGANELYGISIQADGKIVAVGSSTQLTAGLGSTAHIAVARFNADGSVDTSFGGRIIDGLPGADTLTAPDDYGWQINGFAGDDTLRGAAGADTLNGNGGNDALAGGGGSDALTGGGGFDTFVYAAASDSTGSAADLIVDFTTGTDKISLAGVAPSGIGVVQNGGSSFVFVNTPGGGMQINVIGSVQGTDLVTGGVGISLQGDGASTTLLGTQFGDALFGNGGNDVLQGSFGADALFGGAGADTFRVIAASESNSGGSDLIADFVSGTDKVDLSFAGVTAVAIIDQGANSLIFANTPGGQIQMGSIGTVQGFDILAGVGVTILGGPASTQLVGGSLNDTLFGEGGNDLLIGGGGPDVLFGGAGFDTFRYVAADESGSAAPDLIADFQTGIDKIDLTGTGVTAIGIAGNTLFGSGPGGIAMQIGSVTPIALSDVILSSPAPAPLISDAVHATHGMDGTIF